MIYQTQFSTLGQVGDVLKGLKWAGVSTIKVSIVSQNEDFIAQINNNLKALSKVKRKYFPSLVLLGKQEVEIEVVKKRKYKHAIDLSNNMVATIFINEYREKLKALSDQYDLSMIRERSIIKIFSKSPISTVFESRIIDMKRKLKCTIIPNIKLYTKLKFSNYIRRRLEAAKIRVLFLSVNKCVLLHSSQVSIEMMNNMASVFQYETLILNFYNSNFSRIVNRIYFEILSKYCQQLLTKVESDYEIKCEVNKHMLGIIMHTKDPIFESEPKEQLVKLLQNLIYISFYSSKPLEYQNQLKKYKLDSSNFTYHISNTFVYTSWNKLKKVTAADVRYIYRKFILSINQNTWLRIGFNTGGMLTGKMIKVQEVANKYNLVYEEMGQTEKTDKIVHVKFKTFNPQKKKQKMKQISCFLQQIILGSFNNDIDVFETNQNIQIISEIQNSNKKESSSQQQQQQLYTSQPCNEFEMRMPSIQQNSVGALQFKFEKPQVIPSKKTNIRKGKRNKKLEEYVYEKCRVTCKIWNIIVETQYYIPRNYPTSVCQIRPVLQFELQPEMTVKKPKFLSFSSLVNDQIYYLASQLPSSEEFILTHTMIMYNAL